MDGPSYGRLSLCTFLTKPETSLQVLMFFSLRLNQALGALSLYFLKLMGIFSVFRSNQEKIYFSISIRNCSPRFNRRWFGGRQGSGVG